MASSFDPTTTPATEDPASTTAIAEEDEAEAILPPTQLHVDRAPTSTIIEMPSQGASVGGFCLQRGQDLVNIVVRHEVQFGSRPWLPADLDAAGALLNFFADTPMTPATKQTAKILKFFPFIIDSDRSTLPEPYRAIARQLMARWDDQNWGAVAIPDIPTPVPTMTPAVAAAQPPGPQQGQATATRRRRIRMPPANHPVFGDNGMMHHIRSTIGGEKSSLVVDPQYPRPNPSVFGHNGLTVGTCWPLRVAAFRDGAHGAQMAGIAGDYGGLNIDDGEVVYYSGSNSHDNCDPHNAVLSISTRILTTSVATGRPVRVIRGSESGWVGAPVAGFRYDGLYRVDSYSQERNGNGGAYRRFVLRRLAGQPPIATDRPNLWERGQISRYKEGY